MKINTNNYKVFSIFTFVMVGVSALCAYGISRFIQSRGVMVPFYVEIPSMPAIYGFLFWLFDKHLWKYKIFKKLGLVISDNLNGKWIGILTSSYDNFSSKIKAELLIKQTATEIKIYGTFNQSKSVSVHESFGRSEVDDKTALFYFFRNDPRYDAVPTMAMHEGSAKLIYDSGNDRLSGYYYSGRDRNNHGTIDVERFKKQT